MTVPAGILASAYHAPAPPAGLTGNYLTTVGDETNTGTYTFTGVNFGTPAADRNIVVGIVAREWSGSIGAPSSVTIGGVTATQVTTTGVAFQSVAMYRALVPSGSTGTIVVTYPGQATRIGVSVWEVHGTIGSTSASATTASATSISRTVTGAASGFVCAIAMNASLGNTFVWTNATERFDSAVMNAQTSAADTTATGSLTITATPPISSALVLAVAAFGP